MKHLYFCRHGLSVYGSENKWAGSSDSPLAPEGRQQATIAARQAKELQIDFILSSPLSRAHETAVIIAKIVGYPPDSIVQDKRLVERDFGELEGTPFNPHIDMDALGIKGLEPLQMLLERAQSTLAYLQTLEAENILIVSHGSFGRALSHALNPSVPFSKQKRFENAKIVQLL